jgi:hypothetical protein
LCHIAGAKQDEDKGFSRERAEINLLMEAAAVAIFRYFPEAFVLFGGATLVLYHDSVRHSADLDLLWRGSEAPSREDIAACLRRDLSPLAEVLGMGSLVFEFQNLADREARIYVHATERQLFRVDLARLGSAIESEVESHSMDSEGHGSTVIKCVTKDLLLPQKGEAFLLRRSVKARDAYDVHLLRERGAKLTPTLRAHLEDSIRMNEIDSEAIAKRISKIDGKLCFLELKPILPADVYAALEDLGFEPLRESLKELYEEWL